MFDRSNAPLLLFVVLALGVGVRPTGNQSAPQAAVQEQKEKAQPARTATAPEASISGKGQPLENVMETIRGIVRTVPGETREATEDDWRKIAELRPEFLIVTIPDPTFLPSLFDADIESLQRALEWRGYLLDRFWLPWEEEGGEKEARKDRSQASIRWDRYERDKPGVMVFRH